MIHDEVIRQRIEESRQLLYQMEMQYGLRHPKVLKQSMDLDELINRYYRIKYREGMKPIA
ncbi:aspartyl-phosphate phosphatase Spo0E family protein [Paenibacillus sp. N3/727]|uniref:aspartyl-phosphate phosphatase Spo0E family protein n=1 Tax=Paenibacillus sp. N3/727 TaxID=2925845 RepID=UPI001F53D989|nr:aspartyl-phosphate phosphatase Spo0E family protein [Paenibacillus sp. N3/727]UNK19476.1 aspartyl-phosphate phosphatase Spo0E family protein [Paenibacillus sp. N3/727]